MSLLIFYFSPRIFSMLKHFAPGAVLLLLSSHTERKRWKQLCLASDHTAVDGQKGRESSWHSRSQQSQ